MRDYGKMTIEEILMSMARDGLGRLAFNGPGRNDRIATEPYVVDIRVGGHALRGKMAAKKREQDFAKRNRGEWP